MRYENFLELVKTRRSIRHYKPDPVSDGDIEKIIEAARWAPSGFNSQLWEFVVVRDPVLKARVADLVGGAFSEIVKKMPPAERREAASPGKRVIFAWEKAPVFIIALGDTRVRAHSPVPPVRTDDDKWTNVFISSMAIAFQYAALAATSLGLGSQWVSAVGILSVSNKIKEILGIPDAMKIYDMLTLGYPAKEPSPKTVRPLREMLHFDSCGKDDFRTDAQVAAFFR